MKKRYVALKLERRSNSVCNAQMKEYSLGLPGDDEDTHSRYIEATVNGMLICCLYLPNAIPQLATSSITRCNGSSVCKNLRRNY